MASDLSVPRVGTSAAAVEPGRIRGGGQAPPRGAAAPVASAEPVTDAGKPMPNPTLRLDPELALVVIEFRDGAGKVRDTIPTEAQLEAYRASQRTSSAPAPAPGQAGSQGGTQAGTQGGTEAPRPEAGRTSAIRPTATARPEAGAVPPVAEPRMPDVAPPPEAAAAQPRGPADSAVPGLPVKASETGTA